MFVYFNILSNVNAIPVIDSPTGDDKIRHGANLIARNGLLLTTVNVMLVTNSDSQRQETKLSTTERRTSGSRPVSSVDYIFFFIRVKILFVINAIPVTDSDP